MLSPMLCISDSPCTIHGSQQKLEMQLPACSIWAMDPGTSTLEESHLISVPIPTEQLASPLGYPKEKRDVSHP